MDEESGPELRPIEAAWREVAYTERCRLIVQEVAHQGYLGLSPFKAANYDPIRAAVIEGRQELARIIIESIRQEFPRAGLPVPSWLEKIEPAKPEPRKKGRT